MEKADKLEDDTKETEVQNLKDSIQAAKTFITETFDCNNMAQFRRRSTEILNDLRGKARELVGAVQVFVRIRSAPGDETDETCITNIKNAKKFIEVKGKTYKLDVFNPVDFKKNAAVFKDKEDKYESIEDAVKTVLDGKTVVMFGFGASGSGKTHMIFGNGSEDGFAQLAIKMFGKITINVFEECLDEMEYKDNKWTITSKKVPQTKYQNHSIQTVEQFNEALKKIESDRIKLRRIMPTINNVQSSRSHLFIQMNVGGGKLIIADLAGQESPVDIKDSASRKNQGKINMKNEIQRESQSENIIYTMDFEGYLDEEYVKSINQDVIDYNKKKNTTKIPPSFKKNYLSNVLKQGFFITESLNAIKYILRKKRNVNAIKPEEQQHTDLRKFELNKVYNRSDYDDLDNTENKNIKTFKIMNDFGDDARYIMLAAVRPQKKYCDQTAQVLDFAQSISQVL